MIFADVTDPDNVDLLRDPRKRAGRTIVETGWRQGEHPRLAPGERYAYRGGVVVVEPIPAWRRPKTLEERVKDLEAQAVIWG